jgi:hypothetical protein
MRRLKHVCLGASLLVAASGCNLITGADDLHLGSGGSGANGSGGATGGPGSGGAGGAGSKSTGSSPNSGATMSTRAGSGCPAPCGTDEHCEDATSTCVCNPGFADQGGACVAVAPGDPSTRTKAEVCARWGQDHQLTTPQPFVPGSGDCDPGMLKQGAITDTLTRLALFRWLSGLGPVSDDPSLDQTDQLCANLESWWDFSSGQSPHAPPDTSKCYTAQGASGAGMSNIAWGNGPADSIDQFFEDAGNATTLGHRRWLVNPPLGPIGIGYWEGGGMYGSAECLAVFGASGGGPNPAWVAVPNQGVVPLQIAQWTWSFHSAMTGTAGAQASVLRVDDNTPLPITMTPLQQGYGQEAIAWTANGWTAEADKTYRVTISGLAGGDVVYDVKPVTCP